MSYSKDKTFWYICFIICALTTVLGWVLLDNFRIKYQDRIELLERNQDTNYKELQSTELELAYKTVSRSQIMPYCLIMETK